jgi:uncharacterized protein YdaU (DUF1376 family)
MSRKRKVSQKPPSFQFFVKDFLAHAAREMTLEAMGAYIILLAFAWDSTPIATVPKEEAKLRRIVGASDEEWARIAPQVMPKFLPYPDTDDLIYNKRLFMQFMDWKEFTDKSSERGKAGAEARWGNKDEDGAGTESETDADDTATEVEDEL